MARRVLAWCGVVVGVGAVGALGVVFAVAGLDKADQMASVFGAFVGVAGLGVAVYGLTASGGSTESPSEGTRNTVSGVVYGPSVQARDVGGGAERPAPATDPDPVERVWDEEG